METLALGGANPKTRIVWPIPATPEELALTWRRLSPAAKCQAAGRWTLTARLGRGKAKELIRHEISDSLRLAAAPCPCGRPFAVADGIQGRAEEILRFPAKAGGQVQVHPVVIHKVMDAAPAAARQVIQQPGRLRVLVAGARPSLDPAVVTTGICHALDRQGAMPLEITVEHVAAIPMGKTGKTLLIKPLPHRDRVSA